MAGTGGFDDLKEGGIIVFDFFQPSRMDFVPLPLVGQNAGITPSPVINVEASGAAAVPLGVEGRVGTDVSVRRISHTFLIIILEASSYSCCVSIIFSIVRYNQGSPYLLWTTQVAFGTMAYNRTFYSNFVMKSTVRGSGRHAIQTITVRPALSTVASAQLSENSERACTSVSARPVSPNSSPRSSDPTAMSMSLAASGRSLNPGAFAGVSRTSPLSSSHSVVVSLSCAKCWSANEPSRPSLAHQIQPAIRGEQMPHSSMAFIRFRTGCEKAGILINPMASATYSLRFIPFNTTDTPGDEVTKFSAFCDKVSFLSWFASN